MKFLDIVRPYKDILKEEILKLNPTFEILKITKNLNEERFTVYTKKTINGHEYEWARTIRFNEEIEKEITALEGTYAEIQELWDTYTEYCIVNEILQKFRTFEVQDVCTLKLTGMLILPALTENSLGCGDREIKRTPEREEEFLDNIDKYTRLFSDAANELQKIKTEYLEEKAMAMKYLFSTTTKNYK